MPETSPKGMGDNNNGQGNNLPLGKSQVFEKTQSAISKEPTRLVRL